MLRGSRWFVGRRRIVVGLAVAVILAGAGGGAWAATRGASTKASTTALVTVAPRTLRQSVSSTGTIVPAQQASLDFPAAGQVTGVDVKVGQRVRAGQVLAAESSATLQAQVAQAQASVDAAESRVASDESSSASAAALAADQASLTAAQSQLSDAETALTQATLKAPFTGTVASLNLTTGQQVPASGGGGSGGAGSGGAGSAAAAASAATGGFSGGSGGGGSSNTSGNAEIVLISTDSWVVDASVDDTEVGELKAGDQAVITPDGSAAPVYGLLASVGLVGSSSSGVATYPVTINVTGSPPGLRDGMGATVEIIYRQYTNVLAVPVTALHYRSGHAYVYEMAGAKQVAHPVNVSAVVGGFAEVSSGLSAGTQVVVPAAPAGTARGGGAGARGAGGGFRGGFGGCGFGGGGFGGGGFGGGGPGGGFGGGGFGGGGG